MNKLLNSMYQVILYIQVTHWVTKGGAKIEEHDKLGELYAKLREYMDELVETALSGSAKNTDIIPLKSSIDSLDEDMVASVVTKLRSLREEWKEYKDENIEDLKGRIISTLSHYIFVLGTNTPTYQLFSKKEDIKLLPELKNLFKNQDEFVTAFNAWLKGNDIKDDKLEKFFKDNEDELFEISQSILSTNQELFDARSYFVDAPVEVKKEFNNLVKFFSLF